MEIEKIELMSLNDIAKYSFLGASDIKLLEKMQFSDKLNYFKTSYAVYYYIRRN